MLKCGTWVIAPLRWGLPWHNVLCFPQYIYTHLLGISVQFLCQVNNPPFGIQQIFLQKRLQEEKWYEPTHFTTTEWNSK